MNLIFYVRIDVDGVRVTRCFGCSDDVARFILDIAVNHIVRIVSIKVARGG